MTTDGSNASTAAAIDSAPVEIEDIAAVNDNDASDIDDEDDEKGEEEKGDSDSEFELNPDWVSDEDVADREAIISKVQKAKEKLHMGIPVTYHSDDEIDRRQDQTGGQEGFNSSDDGSYDGTDEDDEVADHAIRRKSLFTRFDPNLDTPFFELGMVFSSMNEAKEAIKKYSLAAIKGIKVKQSDQTRLRVVCRYKGCPFVMLVSWCKRAAAFRIKTLKLHRCGLHFKNKYCSPAVIAKKYHRRIRAHPQWRLKDMRETIKEEMGYDVNRMTCSRAKKIVMHLTQGCYKDEYALLWTYAEELRRTNPDTTVRIMVNRDNPEGKPKFQRMYICFGAMKKGFLAGCRKIIALDGCFLKGLCKGELLAAVGRDANDQMYPVAWAVVEVESRSSWDWFLNELRDDLSIDEGAGWAFSSDQMKGLVPAIAEFFPYAEHRLCARHIYSNWRKKFRNRDWQKMFWACAKATTPISFDRAWQRLAAENKDAATALLSIDPKHWCRSYFSTEVKCNTVDNNMSESFNASILEARYKAIFSMLDDLRVMVLEMVSMKMALGNKWNDLYCPKILKKFNKNVAESDFCHILSNGKHGYEVRHLDERFPVQLLQHVCSCRAWELSGIPCPHAIACLVYEDKDPVMYISDCFSIQNFRNTYQHVLQPMDGPKSWIRSEYEAILPPDFRVLPGRPKKKRVRSAEEKEDRQRQKKKRVYTSEELMASDKNDPSKLRRTGRIITCKRCKQEGHNSRSCKAEIPSKGVGHSSQIQDQTESFGTSSRQERRPPKKKNKPFVGVGVHHSPSGFIVMDPGLKSRRVIQVPRSQTNNQAGVGARLDKEGGSGHGDTQESTITV